ncbi:MAG: hypothetical protein HYX64_09555, partial [Gammaproteobacteria bacterium]|nr:hypothetical protein [Gammaproteobacteria bacterium]
DNVDLIGGVQNVDVGSGGHDNLVFDTGTFAGAYTGLADGDTIKFIGDADISGATSPTGANKVDFNDADISVTMTAQQHDGFKHPFKNTDNTQTITLTTSAVQILNDSGIENYVFAGGSDSFFVSADNVKLDGGKQNIDIGAGGGAFILYTPGAFSGNLVGADTDDFVVFLAGPIDIHGVNGGDATGAKIAISTTSSSWAGRRTSTSARAAPTSSSMAARSAASWPAPTRTTPCNSCRAAATSISARSTPAPRPGRARRVSATPRSRSR